MERKNKGRYIERIRRLESQVKDLIEQNRSLDATCDSYSRIIEEKDKILVEVRDEFDKQRAILDAAIREANEQRAAYENAVREIYSLKREYEKQIQTFIKKMKIQGDEF